MIEWTNLPRTQCHQSMCNIKQKSECVKNKSKYTLPGGIKVSKHLKKKKNQFFKELCHSSWEIEEIPVETRESNAISVKNLERYQRL